MNIIDGKALAQTIKDGLKVKAQEFLKKNSRPIGLAVVLVGEDPASQVYVRNKIKACEEIGIQSFTHRLKADSSEASVIRLIKKLNKDNNVDGILVQLPLPRGMSEENVVGTVDPRKDVDGFHIHNAGALFLGRNCLAACTPSGCIELIKATGQPMEGKHAVVIGRSNIVGKPVAMMLLSNGCTVTICHSKTRNLAEVTRQADILVVAIGRKEFVTGDMIKKGAIVIDVGIIRGDKESKKIYGDVNFEQAKEVAGWITPVPGGVGPMTIAMLLKNTIEAAN